MLTWAHFQEAIRPLRFLYFGLVIWLVDISLHVWIGGKRVKFDILDDTVGALLITSCRQAIG